MKQYLRTLYGPGGFDPSKPNNNVIEEYEYEAEPVPDGDLRASALAKLQALGLTEAEALALVGGAG